jgi:hypothetical protein
LDDETKLDNFNRSGTLRSGIRYPVLTNDKISVKENLAFVQAIPMNLFVDRQGMIFMWTLGAIQDEKDFAKLRSIIDNELLK